MLHDPLAVTSKRILGVDVPERFGYVAAAEQDRSTLFSDSNCAEIGVIEWRDTHAVTSPSTLA